MGFKLASFLAVLCVPVVVSGAFAQTPSTGLGRAPTATDLAVIDIDVRPDGRGLPPGSGSAEQGKAVYAARCAACHGPTGREGPNDILVGGQGSLSTARPLKTVGSYWPYATTLWDYINRAMPFPAPHSLTADQVYAITAYILNLNNLVPNDFVADRNSLPKVKMPNHDAFIWKDPRPDTASKACMTNCVDPAKVRIESTAEGKDLTPRTTGPLDDMQPK